MYLFFDTETTGKFDFKAPCYADHQPHIVELAAMLVNEDLEEQSSFNVLIQPDGWEIPEEVTEIHGITTEQCNKYGITMTLALGMFASLASGIPHGNMGLRSPVTIVAHNIAFDMAMLERELNGSRVFNFLEKPRYCTMQKSTDICRIPNKWGKHKWPTLAEAFRHFYGKDFVGAHRAMTDVKACRAVFARLRELNV